jgi:hypothetical protein
MRRSFRTHEGCHTQTQGVALGWYESPLQGESECLNPESSLSGESKYPNSGSPLQSGIRNISAGVRRLFRAKQDPLAESIATIRSMDVVGPVKRREWLTYIRLRTGTGSDKN